jgi:hypothetical protein
MLQKFQEVKAERVLEELDVGRLRPVAVQVLEVVDEAAVLEVAALRQKVEVVRVRQTLNKFQFNLKPGKNRFLKLVLVVMPVKLLKRSLKKRLIVA